MTLNFKAWLGLVVVATVGLSLPVMAEDPAKPAAAPATPAAAPAAANPAPAAQAAPAPAAATPAPAAAAPAAGSVGSGWSAEVAPGKGGLTLDDAQKGLVKQVGDYFEGISTLRGAFVQMLAF